MFQKSSTTCTQNINMLEALVNWCHELAMTIDFDIDVHNFPHDEMVQSPNQAHHYWITV